MSSQISWFATRSRSPYRELSRSEVPLVDEPLIQFSPPTSPTGEAFDSNGPAISSRGRRPRPPSSTKSDYQNALETARENSLLDLEDAEAQLVQPLSFQPLVNGTAGSTSGSSLHPQDIHRRLSVSSTSTSNGLPRGRERSPGPTVRSRKNSAAGPAKRMCRGCKTLGEDRSLCNVCNVSLCNICWDTQITHMEDARAAGGIPHEKTNPELAEKIKACLEPSMTDKQQKKLHIDDENTTWFGVAQDEMQELTFEDYGRYANIMADCSSGRKGCQYPSMVSFVGQTGAGKSTLIKMLIELTPNGRHGPVPVVGSINHSIPTSGDVHLYSDPVTYATSFPILYADCEGLEGGEIEPMAAQAKRDMNQGFDIGHTRRTGSFQKRLRKKHHSSQREITWAITPEQKSRQYSVKNLYPRLLYTFSDVCVFVLKNSRTIESVVEQLIVWASTALEKSTNQPVLPYVIIALNATENAIDPQQWDVTFATEDLMRTASKAIFAKPSFKKHIDFWKDRKRPIRDAQDLLCCYYSSVRVVRIPTRGRPQLIGEQLGKLYDEIREACETSRHGRKRKRMLLDADELQPYLQYAFDHFSSDLDMPFDFVKASILNNPIPKDFGGNILQLAINVMNVFENRVTGEVIFDELSVVVASCIMLDAARNRMKGTAESIFREHYMVHCDDAIEDFCECHWPCEFSSSEGRCVNVRSGHSRKGHQLRNGKPFGSGPYQSSFSAENYSDTWKCKIHHDLEILLRMLREACGDYEREELVASRIHKNFVLTPFFQHVKSSDYYVSHSTCFSCLITPPEHMLPCSHVICTPCLQAYSAAKGEVLMEITSCPLWHERPTTWDEPWRIVLKPASAGIRILTLDGGGIRGIAELEILRLIQVALGGKIPLQAFFDLIVGTSAGGIIALGIGVEGWNIDRCIEEFKLLCRQAFTPRRGHSIWGISQMIQAHNGSIYSTQPLQKALQGVFSSDRLFGGQRLVETFSKVALTTTSAAGLQPILLSNYNRTIDREEKRSYIFQRPEKPEAEMDIWEAARATSAAPTYYKPFPHEPSKQTYIDGGIWHNNPVNIAESERKLIWPDTAHLPPDILLSIGSGCCQTLPTPKRPSKAVRRRGIGSNIKAYYRIAVDHIESSLDSERIWREYLERLSPSQEQKRRYRRLNVQLEEAPPKLDDVDSIDELQTTARKHWSRDPRISDVAQDLIASSFYFEKDRLAVEDDGSYACRGHIKCRFIPGSQHVRDLGIYLRDCQTDTHSPFFVIQEQYRAPLAEFVRISHKVIDDMIRDGRFQLELIKFRISRHHASSEIFICLKDENSYIPISGFPRTLQQENSQKVARQLGSTFDRRRTRSQRRQRGQWSGPQSPYALAPDNDTVSRYSDPSYVMGSSSRESLAAITQRFSRSMDELPGNDIPDISIQEMEDTSTTPTEFQVCYQEFRFELEAGVNNDEREYMRPRQGWDDYS